MAFNDEDFDELRRRVTALVQQNDLLILRNALLIASGDKLAATADAQCREVVSFALHDAVAAWRTACAAHADDVRLAEADAEQRGYERGLADRDERCLQSDMQRIREKLAFERGREAGAAPWEAIAEAEQDDPALYRRLLFTRRDAVIPCGIHACTAKRDGLWGYGRTWTEAARDLCTKLRLNLAKDGE